MKAVRGAGREGGRDVVGAALQLVLLWPCPPCSLSHFLFLTWNLYLEPSLLSALHSWVNSESREMNTGLKSDLHSPQKLRVHAHTGPPRLTRLLAVLQLRFHSGVTVRMMEMYWEAPMPRIAEYFTSSFHMLCCLHWLSWVSLAFYKKNKKNFKKISQTSHCPVMEVFVSCSPQLCFIIMSCVQDIGGSIDRNEI